jgi:DNA-binding transcriptional MerR regulator
MMRNMAEDILSIGELARLAGLSTHTLRYYEAEGILQPAGRAANGHRRYRQADLAWLEFVLRLKHTGMPLAEIRRYAALRAQGRRTLQARLAMLKAHRERLLFQMKELASSARALEEKIAAYRKMLAQPTTTRKRRTS